MKMRIAVAGLLVLGAASAGLVLAQQGGFNPQRVAREALSEPFVGMTRGGEIERGLLEIEPTGVSTRPVVDAARDFIGALSEERRAKTLFPADDPEWRNWPISTAFGVRVCR